MRVVSIDIGYYHLGLVAADINSDYTLDRIIDVELVDITELCNDSDCKLHHEKCAADYMTHFFCNYGDVLESADRIVIEQQPPTGLIVIQELIRYQYRNKTETVSPRSVHCYFGINSMDYDLRKTNTVQFANDALSGFRNYVFQSRKHDIADSYCQLIYWLHIKHSEYVRRESLGDYGTLIRSMESLRFTI